MIYVVTHAHDSRYEESQDPGHTDDGLTMMEPLRGRILSLVSDGLITSVAFSSGRRFQEAFLIFFGIVGNLPKLHIPFPGGETTTGRNRKLVTSLGIELGRGESLLLKDARCFDAWTLMSQDIPDGAIFFTGKQVVEALGAEFHLASLYKVDTQKREVTVLWKSKPPRYA